MDRYQQIEQDTLTSSVKLVPPTQQAVGQINEHLHNGNLTTTIAKSIQDIERLRVEWQSFHPSPTASIDYLLTLIETNQGNPQPFVILLKRNETPETMLVGVISDTPYRYRAGDRVLFGLTVRTLAIVVKGIIGNTSPENCKFLISEVRQALNRREADMAYFQETPTESHIFKLATSIPFLWRDHHPEIENHHKMTLAPSLDDFYASKNSKIRYNLRSSVKKLNKKFSGNVTIRAFRAANEIDLFCKETEEISKKSWQHTIGKGFVNDFSTRKLLTSLAEQGHFRGYILYIEDQPCAFNYGYIDQNAFVGEYTGYDLNYRNYGVGTVLLLKVIEDLCNDSGFEFFDFGWMEAGYKDNFCDLSWPEAHFFIFQPSLKGAFLNGAKTVARSLPQLKERFLEQQKKLNIYFKKLKAKRTLSDRT